jgi:hypothetical protein
MLAGLAPGFLCGLLPRQNKQNHRGTHLPSLSLSYFLSLLPHDARIRPTLADQPPRALLRAQARPSRASRSPAPHRACLVCVTLYFFSNLPSHNLTLFATASPASFFPTHNRPGIERLYRAAPAEFLLASHCGGATTSRRAPVRATVRACPPVAGLLRPCAPAWPSQRPARPACPRRGCGCPRRVAGVTDCLRSARPAHRFAQLRMVGVPTARPRALGAACVWPACP